MVITPKSKLDPLLDEYPFLLEFLAAFSPHYQKLKNPLLRKTVGRLATLDQAARLGEMPVGRLMEAIAAEVRRVTDEAVRVEAGGSGAPPAPFQDRESRKEVLKDIIRELHRGGDVEVLRRRFADLVADISGADIAALEQELINEGLPEEEIQKLCDLHVRVFKDALEEHPAPSTTPGHPLHTLADENRALEKIVAEIREIFKMVTGTIPASDWAGQRLKLAGLLKSLAEVDKHYLKKENQLFPALEAKGISGPSKVMWVIHDDIRRHLKDARAALEGGDKDMAAKATNLVLTEISDMIYKEEKIFFPMSLEKLDEADWARVKSGEEEVGYAWIQPGRDWTPAVPGAETRPAVGRSAPAGGPALNLDTGSLSPDQVNLLLNHLPVDVSFVDENDTVVYYSATPGRIFPRSPGVIGRRVQDCHPPTSVKIVEEILEAFKAGRRNLAEFWIERAGRFILIRYFAVREPGGQYRGCLEVTQDVTDIRALQGQKRLLDWT